MGDGIYKGLFLCIVRMAKKTKFKKIKGEIKAECDHCGKERKLRYYNKEGDYVCKSCGPSKKD